MAEKYPKLRTDLKLQIQEAQKTPSKINTERGRNRIIPRYIIFKMQKTKDKKKIFKEG